MKILLIAGHGAGDPGACSTIKGALYREADETRAVVKLLKPILADYAEVGVYGIDRNAFSDSQAGELGQRLVGWDYVLEIHFNSCAKDLSGNGRTTGSEIFWPSRNNKASGAENAILGNLAALGFTRRRAEANALAVINTAAGRGCRANLLEVCFVDDADDMALYTGNRQKVAQAIADGVITGFGLEEKEVRYTYLKDIPAAYHFRDIIDDLMTAGVINGDGSDLTGNKDKIDLSHDMVRMFVMEYNGGVYDAKLNAKGIGHKW